MVKNFVQFTAMIGKKNFKKLKDALCLDYVVKNLTLKDVNAVIKELRK